MLACLAAITRLLDREPGCLRFRFFWQRQFKNAINEFRAGTRFVDFMPKLETARNLAVIAFRAKDALAVLDFLVHFTFCADRNDRAVDVDIDIFFFSH